MPAELTPETLRQIEAAVTAAPPLTDTALAAIARAERQAQDDPANAPHAPAR